MRLLTSSSGAARVHAQAWRLHAIQREMRSVVRGTAGSSFVGAPSGAMEAARVHVAQSSGGEGASLWVGCIRAVQCHQAQQPDAYPSVLTQLAMV